MTLMNNLMLPSAAEKAAKANAVVILPNNILLLANDWRGEGGFYDFPTLFQLVCRTFPISNRFQ